jgi:hypothetical protein
MEMERRAWRDTSGDDPSRGPTPVAVDLLQDLLGIESLLTHTQILWYPGGTEAGPGMICKHPHRSARSLDNSSRNTLRSFRPLFVANRHAISHFLLVQGSQPIGITIFLHITRPI